MQAMISQSQYQFPKQKDFSTDMTIKSKRLNMQCPPQRPPHAQVFSEKTAKDTPQKRIY